MSDPTFGISITRIDNEPRPAVWSDMSVVGLIGTAPAADAAIFPADTPVFMYSDDSAKRTALGASGTIPEAAKNFRSPAVAFGGMKDLITGLSDTSAGALVSADWRGLLDGLAQFARPLTLASLITTGSTTSPIEPSCGRCGEWRICAGSRKISPSRIGTS